MTTTYDSSGGSGNAFAYGRNVLIGGMPSQGKSVAARVLALLDTTDHLAEAETEGQG
ncbi:MAG: hypothetical protein ACRDP8_06080 [Actinopolymorphaceae bacterium]